MSRTGRKPIVIPDGAEFKVVGSAVSVKGSRGTLSYDVPSCVNVSVESGKVLVAIADVGDKKAGALQGLARTLISNMAEGVTKGFSKDLEIQGVGFKAELKGRELAVYAGFAKSVNLQVPEGVDAQVNDNTKIVISGADKQQVGDFAARVRKIFPAEPYKGKGIRYKNEHVRRKAGKTVA